MIDGTRPFRGKKNDSPASEKLPKLNAPETVAGDAVNLDRRKWLNSLVPALGAGLVEILRASNNLKSDLAELAKKDSE